MYILGRRGCRQNCRFLYEIVSNIIYDIKKKLGVFFCLTVILTTSFLPPLPAFVGLQSQMVHRSKLIQISL